MEHVQSTFTELPANCKSAADGMAQALVKEDRYADLNEGCRGKITALEKELSRDLNEQVALVAYRI